MKQLLNLTLSLPLRLIQHILPDTLPGKYDLIIPFQKFISNWLDKLERVVKLNNDM